MSVYTPASVRRYPGSSMQRRSERSHESPMDGVVFNTPRRELFNHEPPRKRTHYESEDMDIEWSSAPSGSAASTSYSNARPGASTGGGAFSAFASGNPAPFLFHSSDVKAFASSSTGSTYAGLSASQNQPPPLADNVDTAQPRDIAAGGVQRERKKRDKLKDWQLAKSAIIEDEDMGDTTRDDGDGDANDPDEDDEIPNNDSPGFSATIKSLMRRNRSKRGQPLHFSLHHHHYPSGHDPFVFQGGSSSQSLTAPSTSNTSSASTSSTSSSWWREEGPYVLLGYLQFTFNVSLVLLALYLLSSFILMLSADIRERTHEYSIELQQEIMHCSEMYVINRCRPEERVPAMDKQCKDWEFCMNRNPKVVGKARVGAETLAEVVNSFFEVISWRTMLFLLAILTVLISFTNRTISDYRRGHTKYHQVHQGQMQAEQEYSKQHKQRPSLMSFASAPAHMDTRAAS